MLNKILFLLENSWDIDTTYNKDIYKCAVSSLIINDYLGGIIGKIKVDGVSHYFNVIDGRLVDSTKKQFDYEINYDNYEIVSRDYILENIDTKNRYNILKIRVDNLLKEFNSINNEVNTCDKCISLVERFSTKETISFGINNDVLILGEAPANNGWRKSGIAWYDISGKLLPSGKVLKELLKFIDVELENTFFMEAIKCFPIKRSNLNTCKKNCRNYLFRQINLIKPKVIITLGDYATRALLDIKYSKFNEVVGRVFELDIDGTLIKVVPVYHPSPISPLSYKGNIDIFNITIKNILKKD